MTIKANSATNPDAGDAVVLRSWQTFLEDVQISDARRHAIRLTNLSANGTPLTNTQVSGRIAENQINRSGGSGLFVANRLYESSISDNYIEDFDTTGVTAHRLLRSLASLAHRLLRWHTNCGKYHAGNKYVAAALPAQTPVSGGGCAVVRARDVVLTSGSDPRAQLSRPLPVPGAPPGPRSRPRRARP